MYGFSRLGVGTFRLDPLEASIICSQLRAVYPPIFQTPVAEISQNTTFTPYTTERLDCTLTVELTLCVSLSLSPTAPPLSSASNQHVPRASYR